MLHLQWTVLCNGVQSISSLHLNSHCNLSLLIYPIYNQNISHLRVILNLQWTVPCDGVQSISSLHLNSHCNLPLLSSKHSRMVASVAKLPSAGFRPGRGIDPELRTDARLRSPLQILLLPVSAYMHAYVYLCVRVDARVCVWTRASVLGVAI